MDFIRLSYQWAARNLRDCICVDHSDVTEEPERTHIRRRGVFLAGIGFLAALAGATGFGFALLWLGVALVLPGSAARRTALGFLAAVVLLGPASAVRTHDATDAKSHEFFASSNTRAVIPVAEAAEGSGRFEIVSADSRTTESNEVFSKLAWKLVLSNAASEALSCRATIEFLDAGGFVVDYDNEYDLVLPPNQEESFSGYALLTAATAANVRRTRAHANCR